jgi:predicted RND superfamily exporter protein
MLTMFHDPLTWIPRDKEIRKAMDEMEAHVGGTASIALLIEAKEGETLKNRELLLKLEKLEAYLRDYKDPRSGDDKVVSATISLLDIIKESWRAVNGENEAYYRIPDTERGVDDMITLFENAAPDQLKRLATVDMMNSVMTVRVKWMDAGSYAPLTAYVDRGVKKFIGDSATVKVTGTVRMVFMVISTLLTDLVKSFGTAFFTVTIVMIFLLRGIKLGLVSMVPNLMPVVAVMGIMGFASIPLDMANLIIASIIIGIAVDDTIHFLHQFRMHHLSHGDVDAALDHAFSHTGRAMAATSVMLVVGFCVFLTASIYPMQRFGILTGAAIVFAFVFDVIVGPALIRIIFRKKEEHR